MRRSLGFAVVFAGACAAVDTDADIDLGEVPPQVQSFDQNEAHFFVSLATSAYCEPFSLAEWSCPYCVDGIEDVTVQTNTEHVLQSFVAYDSDDDRVIVSFRGTVSSSVHDWLTDMDIAKVSPYSDLGSKVEVHSGFYTAWNRLKAQVSDAVTEHAEKYSTSRVAFTGHSLGGALATLAAFDYAREAQDLVVDAVYSAGSPRVGNDHFARAFERVVDKTWRLTHHNDVVVHMPLEGEGYEHIYQEVWFNKGNTGYTICRAQHGEDQSCADSVPGWETSTVDHLNYMGVTMGRDGCSIAQLA